MTLTVLSEYYSPGTYHYYSIPKDINFEQFFKRSYWTLKKIMHSNLICANVRTSSCGIPRITEMRIEPTNSHEVKQLEWWTQSIYQVVNLQCCSFLAMKFGNQTLVVLIFNNCKRQIQVCLRIAGYLPRKANLNEIDGKESYRCDYFSSRLGISIIDISLYHISFVCSYNIMQYFNINPLYY